LSEPSFGELVAAKGWRTGSVISPTLYEAVQPFLARPHQLAVMIGIDDWLVIASQACDVVAQNEEAEPLVEVLRCSCIAEPRAEYRDVRSTRVLDFRPNRETHAQVVLTAHATTDRFLVPRRILIQGAPDETRSLNANATKRILWWTALRYARPAWPNAFVQRLPKKKSLEKILESLPSEVEVRVAITPSEQELPETEAYKLAVYFIVPEETVDAGVREAIHAAFGQFVAAVDKCAGIDVEQDLSQVRMGDEFTWQETRSTDEWNFANLSYLEAQT